MDWSKIEKDVQMHTEYLSTARRERGSVFTLSSQTSQATAVGRSPSVTGRRNLYAIDEPKANTSMSQLSQGICWNRKSLCLTYNSKAICELYFSWIGATQQFGLQRQRCTERFYRQY